jgi:glycosyltransferase involved in cell wall biosynthesis
MRHLIISREYPPSPYSDGGIGTYVDHISRLLAEHGETVHVIAQMWPGASHARETRQDGRLTIHRLPLDEPLRRPPRPSTDRDILKTLVASRLPSQAFMWQAAMLAESLVDSEGIDVIDSQEYEAPEYVLLLRRSLGVAAARPVPVIVQLHSPTELVFAYNDWDQNRTDYLPLKRAEAQVIRAADALVCPSRYLARMAESHYELEAGSVEVIPYPVEVSNVTTRAIGTWEGGTISYVGRLEPRKGVIEWIEAAVAVALEHAAAQFSLIGADTPRWGTGDESTRDALLARIPHALRSRFTFVGAVPRSELAGHLARARFAVVPSRWENFPFTCIEAMLSGLPVLVSPTGGMAEMVEDGRTGWVASGSDARSLEHALRRALATPPEVLAGMGAAAAAAIRVLCDSGETVRRHVAFRREIVMRGCRPALVIDALPDAGAIPSELATCSAGDLAVLPYLNLQLPADAGPRSQRPSQGEKALTLVEILRAPRLQKIAVLRRAVTNPAYILRWVAWHTRRLFRS